MHGTSNCFEVAIMRNSETSVQCLVCRSCCEIIVTNWPSVLVALHVYARDTSQSALTLSRGTWHMLPSHPSLFIFTRGILTAAPWFRPRLMCNNVPAQCRVGKVRRSPGKSFPKSALTCWAALGPGRQGSANNGDQDGPRYNYQLPLTPGQWRETWRHQVLWNRK